MVQIHCINVCVLLCQCYGWPQLFSTFFVIVLLVECEKIWTVEPNFKSSSQVGLETLQSGIPIVIFLSFGNFSLVFLLRVRIIKVSWAGSSQEADIAKYIHTSIHWGIFSNKIFQIYILKMNQNHTK